MATIVVLTLRFLSVNRRPSLPHPFNTLPQPTKDLTTDANAARAEGCADGDAGEQHMVGHDLGEECGDDGLPEKVQDMEKKP